MPLCSAVQACWVRCLGRGAWGARRLRALYPGVAPRAAQCVSSFHRVVNRRGRDVGAMLGSRDKARVWS